MYWNKNHIFYVADIRDQHVMDTIFQIEKPDIVLHGAAETFVDYSLSDPNSFVTSNVLGTQIIVNSCVKYKVDKLIYVSTDEVYGQLTSESDSSWTEACSLNPRNPYAATKAAGELLVKAAHESFGLKYNITRSSNNYGPRQTTEKLIPKTIKCILQGKKIPVYGKGLQVRDWTHVYDNCSAIFNIINNGIDNETYNIAANQEFSNIEVIHKICKVIDKGYDLIEHIDDPRGNGHDFRYSVNPTKIKNEGIDQCVNWYLMNQWMFK
jgi:dTDP-glucose 4,6-dehydratase